MCKLQPTGNRLLVRPLNNDQNQTASGLYVPVTTKGLQKGTVVAAGRGAIAMDGSVIPMEIQKNFVVFYDPRQGNEIVHEGETLVVLHETDVHAFEYRD